MTVALVQMNGRWGKEHVTPWTGMAGGVRDGGGGIKWILSNSIQFDQLTTVFEQLKLLFDQLRHFLSNSGHLSSNSDHFFFINLLHILPTHNQLWGLSFPLPPTGWAIPVHGSSVSCWCYSSFKPVLFIVIIKSQYSRLTLGFYCSYFGSWEITFLNYIKKMHVIFKFN